MGCIAYPNRPMTVAEVRKALREARRAKHSDRAMFLVEELSVRHCEDAALEQRALAEAERIRQSKPYSGWVYGAAEVR